MNKAEKRRRGKFKILEKTSYRFPIFPPRGARNTRNKFLFPWPASAVEKAVAAKREAEAVRVVVIDSLSPRMFPPSGPYTLKIVPAKSPSELRALLNKYLQDMGARAAGWIHFIKHERTLEVLRTEFYELSPVPNFETYRYEFGDVLLVAVLRRKPTRANPCVPASPEDLSYWLVIVRPEAAGKP